MAAADGCRGTKATIVEMEKVMRFWLQMGCDGFRVDMAGSLVKNDPDGLGTIRPVADHSPIS